MANWVLSCKNCNKTFSHSEVGGSLADHFLPQRPEFPAGGLEQECPHCNTTAVYQQHELTYQG